MDNKTIDDILDKLIAEAGPLAIEEMTKDDLANLDKHEIDFSPEHEEKMKEIFAKAYESSDSQLKKNNMTSFPSNKPKKIWRKLGVLAAVLVLLLGLSISSVSGWRESFVKYFFRSEEKYSKVKNYKNGIECVVDEFYFGYLPEGYEYKNKKVLNTDLIISFVNSQGCYITLDCQQEQWGQEVNTEGAKLTDLYINDKDMVYSERDDMKFITWHEGNFIYTLYTNDTKDILTKVVEKLEIMEND